MFLLPELYILLIYVNKPRGDSPHTFLQKQIMDNKDKHIHRLGDQRSRSCTSDRIMEDFFS